MTRKVPFLAEEAIERDAEALLAEFSHARDVVIELPIPIEDIVDKHLKLRIEFDDMHVPYIDRKWTPLSFALDAK